jgi:hypothetical protein
MPFSIIGSTEDVQTPDGRVVKGRQYSWGVAEGKEGATIYIEKRCSARRKEDAFYSHLHCPPVE